MTEKEKMLSGQPCNAHDPETEKLKKEAQTLVYTYNQTKPIDTELRASILQKLFGSWNNLVWIEPSFHCDFGFNIHFEGMAFINYNCTMLDTAPIYIGDNAFIGPGTCFACPAHALLPRERSAGICRSTPICLEKDVWIGANCTILGGVTIGEGSVIGAGSVVTKNIPPGVTAAGNPCKVLRQITEEDKLLAD